MPDGQDTAALIDLACRAEQAAAELYGAWAARLDAHPDVAALWRDMAEDERKHAAVLGALLGSLPDERLKAPADADLLRRAQRNLAFVQQAGCRETTNLDQAYELAHELEDSEVNAVFRDILLTLVPEEDQPDLLLSLDDHLRRLIEFTRDVGDASWRRSIRL